MIKDSTKNVSFYTSYFAKLKDLPEDIVPISICGKAPAWYTGIQYKKLAPKYSFFAKYKEDGDAEHYDKCFQEQVLGVLDFNQTIEELMNLSGGKDIALICYEKPTDFCHRQLVADWIREHGLECSEYEFQKKTMTM